jgi:viroplasmin and RNaseH domain-containing protein
MTIDFTDSDDFVETIHNDYEEDESFSEAKLDDDFSEAGTENSVSDYEGKVQEAPLKMLFGLKECRAVFAQPTDQGAFMRVCGNKEGTCKRGHPALDKAQEGYYVTVASRKYVDGRLHTFQSKPEYRAELKQVVAQRDKRLAESVAFLASLEDEEENTGPTRTQKIDRKPTSVISLSKSEGKERTSSSGPRSSLKKAPVYSEPPEKAQPLPAQEPPPGPQGLGSVEFMVGALTDTLKDLKTEMQDLKQQVSRTGERPPNSPSVSSDSKPSGLDSTDWWHGVGKGKHGASGVFSSWAEASNLVLGISGAVFKKFRDYDEAAEFVKTCRVPEPKNIIENKGEGPTTDPVWYAVANGKHGVCNIFNSWEEASEFVLGTSGALVEKFNTRGAALAFLGSNPQLSNEEMTTSPSDTEPKVVKKNTQRNSPGALTGDGPNYRPPMVLTGPDPSAKKSDEVFGVDLGSEVDLRAALLPPNLPDGVSKGLANAMVDVIAIPGGFCGGTNNESDGNEMALLGEAMEELVSQGRSQMEGAAKADLHWRSSKRTSLRQISGLDSLRKRIKVLLKMRDKVVKHTIIAVRNACKRGGWEDLERIEAWAHGGYLTRLTRDSLDYYLSLHQHLMGLLSAGAPWSYVKMEQDHHIEELDLIRTTQDSRLQALCSLYAYLRDGQNKNWHSDELQYKRNMDIFARTTEGGVPGTPEEDLSTLGGSSSHCDKCGTNLHSGGRENCPWNSMSNSAARKLANKFIRNMATGPAGTPPVP